MSGEFFWPLVAKNGVSCLFSATNKEFGNSTLCLEKVFLQRPSGKLFDFLLLWGPSAHPQINWAKESALLQKGKREKGTLMGGG